jgi:tRNA U34 5-carboxymethylaminomethyl modifying enzyme MnmG/GidA
MALPQNPLSNSDRAVFDTLNAQNDNLKAQTKVLHKLSDSIADQRKEFSELRKSFRESQKEFFAGNDKGMSEIRKYFEKYKSAPSGDSKIRDKDQSTGFFKNALNKLFGPSKYQQKTIDEITRLREITELQALDINFIKRQNEEIIVLKENYDLEFPTNFDFNLLNSVSNEEREKLNFYKPKNLASASKIPGITQNAILSLMISVKNHLYKRAIL